MNKILHIPLDERPCNYEFPKQIFQGGEWEILTLPFSYLGLKKKPAQIEKIQQWVLNNYQSAYGIVISIDMLLYGGIVPSRIHYFSFEELKERLNILKLIKSKRPDFKIYAYNLVMRCPQYNDDDEEPSYYQNYGLNIFRHKYIEHKKSLNIATNEELEEEKQIFIPEEFVLDYETRRMTNLQVVLEVINLVKENIIDFLIIPQDDSAPYGYTAKDQIKVRSHIQNLRLDLKVLMYPDADAVTNTLLARAINDLNKFKPKVFVRYASSTNGNLVPLYEDRNVSESIKYQIMAAGGLNVYDYSLADMILMVNIPGYDMQEAVNQKNNYLQYSVFRNLVEYVEFIDYLVKEKKTVIVADIAYANGGDLLLLSMLKEKNLLYKVNAYAGWNTSANTLGTCIPHGMINHIYKDSQAHLDFLALRYLEDLGYMSVVRNKIFQEISKEGMNWFTIDGKRGKVSKRIWKALNEFAQENLNTLEYEVEIIDNFQPWERMFETELVVKLNEKDLVKN